MALGSLKNAKLTGSASLPKETLTPEQVGLKRLMNEMGDEKKESIQSNFRSININKIDWRHAALDSRTGIWTVGPQEGFPDGKFEYRVYFEGEWYLVLGWMDIRAVDTDGDDAEKWVDNLNKYVDRRAGEH